MKSYGMTGGVVPAGQHTEAIVVRYGPRVERTPFVSPIKLGPKQKVRRVSEPKARRRRPDREWVEAKWTPPPLPSAEWAETLVDRVTASRPKRKPRRLTAEVVAEIKARLAKGQSGTEVARIYGVSKQHVTSIKHGRRWADVAPAERSAA